jgi:DNA polymerase-1
LPVQDLIASFLAHFKGVAAFVEATKAAARAQGGVRTLLGRQRPIKGLAATDKRVRAEAERKAVNSVVQGSAADLMKRAMVDWCRWAEAAGRPPARIVAQVGCGRACVV